MEQTNFVIWNTHKYVVERYTVEDYNGNVLYTGNDFKRLRSDNYSKVIVENVLQASEFLRSNGIQGKIICWEKVLNPDCTSKYVLSHIVEEK